MPDINSSENIVDLSNQPVLVPFVIEDRPLADGIRACKCLADFGQILPLSFLRNAKPRVERAFQISVPCGGLFKLLTADDMHAAPRKLRNLRTFYFAKREVVKRGNYQKPQGLRLAWF